jgi:ligand-binding SRPBCC domain-containing protein
MSHDPEAPGSIATRDRSGEPIRISHSPIGRGSRLEATQFLPHPREIVFQFFADAYQLEAITPPWLRFVVLNPPPITMQVGLRIDYRLRLHGLRIRWQSAISAWEPPVRFVDEQLRGPYRRWHHEHRFEPIDGGTLCRGVVDYEVPGGRFVDRLFVRRDLREIFRFRQHKLAELFAAGRAVSSPAIASSLTLTVRPR